MRRERGCGGRPAGSAGREATLTSTLSTPERPTASWTSLRGRRGAMRRSRARAGARAPAPRRAASRPAGCRPLCRRPARSGPSRSRAPATRRGSRGPRSRTRAADRPVDRKRPPSELEVDELAPPNSARAERVEAAPCRSAPARPGGPRDHVQVLREVLQRAGTTAAAMPSDRDRQAGTPSAGIAEPVDDRAGASSRRAASTELRGRSASRSRRGGTSPRSARPSSSPVDRLGRLDPGRASAWASRVTATSTTPW